MSLSLKLIACRICVFLSGLFLLKPRPDWSPLGVKFKISDEHPRLFHMGVPPPGIKVLFKTSKQSKC